MAVYQKIREARRLLKLTQEQFSHAIGVSQKDISLLESGKKQFIPNEYIQYLYNMNIDLNSLYEKGSKVRFNLDSKMSPKVSPKVSPNFEKGYVGVEKMASNVASNSENAFNLLKSIESVVESKIDNLAEDIERKLYIKYLEDTKDYLTLDGKIETLMQELEKLQKEVKNKKVDKTTS